MANKDSTVVSATLDLVPSNKVGKTLSLTVRGSEAKFGWRFPTVRYAVNRLTIHLDTDDCILPEEDWNLDTIAIGELDVQHEFSETAENTRLFEGAWTPASSTPLAKASLSTKRGSQRGEQKARRYSARHQPILAHGDASNASWSVTSEHPLSPLLGTLIKDSRFCRAEPTGLKPRVTVSYLIPYDALIFRRIDGSFFSGNKFGIVRLLVRASICEKKQGIGALEGE